ncbi:MAG: hypothetical protein IT298_05235 [Chloroflexi bacterium]|nr:MAG: hypothetical protein UZ13_00418 [Chloroflexi bacterium OLB13]MBV6435745.1 hypothetical protein [Anaerolineae bacterium]MCC6565147.1 hypothetical protein [Chloroflexota bacterium]MDL1915834.1 hypothetical protein [Anaerolineae bacterium CFX4]MBW7878724.1 hypothetical protein [Anaerolineae bacterium]
MRRLDSSRRLGRMIDLASSSLARRRGLPVIIGILLVAVALIIDLVGYASNSRALQITGTIIHSVGVLFALVGLTLATPLGK